MEPKELKGIIEALIFVSEEPVTLNTLAMALADAVPDKAAIESALTEMIADYAAQPERGIAITEVAGGYQFRSKPAIREWIQKLNVPKPMRLSRPAMETLAIIAYRQPITRAEIEDVRGVDSGGVLKTLLERSLIKIVGKRDDVGTPLIYATTAEFLSVFNLKSLTELPTLRELTELDQQHIGGLSAPGSDATVPLPPVAMITDLVEGSVSEAEKVGQDQDDQRVIHELETEIRSIRYMEKEIFPKAKEVDVVDLVNDHLTSSLADQPTEPTAHADTPPQIHRAEE